MVFDVAIYRCEAKAISRGQGRSCVAAAAYRHAVELRDERQQLTHGYERKRGVEHSEIIAPEDAPEWATDREKLWNHIDAAEKRKDAMTAREVLLALPRKLSLDQQAEAVRAFVGEHFTARGIIADIAIHAPDARDGEKQPHAHIMVSDRPLDASRPNGLAAKKDRTLADAEGIEALREAWGRHCNAALERAGLGERVDHRSLKAQRAEALAIANDNAQPAIERRLAEVKAVELDRQPEPKIGAVAAAMDRQGRGEKAHALREALVVRQEKNQLRDLAHELHQVVEQTARTLQAGRDQVAALWRQAETAFGRYREDIRRRELIGEPIAKPTPKPQPAATSHAASTPAETAMVDRPADPLTVFRQAVKRAEADQDTLAIEIAQSQLDVAKDFHASGKILTHHTSEIIKTGQERVFSRLREQQAEKEAKKQDAQRNRSEDDAQFLKDWETRRTVLADEIRKHADKEHASTSEQIKDIRSERQKRFEALMRNRPERPTGFFGFLKQNQYENSIDLWEKSKLHIENYNKDTERRLSDHLESFKGLLSTDRVPGYPNRADRAAEDQMRAQSPDQARRYDRIQAAQLEARRRKTLDQIQQKRPRGRDGGGRGQ